MPILAVPEIPQWSSTASKRRNDCGVACVAMCLSRYGLLGGLTVDQLAMETSLAQQDNGLAPSELVRLAERHGLPARARAHTTLADIRAEIDCHRPVIVLVAFRWILGRLDQADNQAGRDGHFMVITGYDDSHIVCNDPDVWYPHISRGIDLTIPVAQIEPAMAEYNGQCVFMEIERMTIGDQISAHISAGKAELDQAQELTSQIQDNPKPTPTPLILGGEQEQLYVSEAVNVRSLPTVQGERLGSLPTGTMVIVQGNQTIKEPDGSQHAWTQIVGVSRPSFVAREYLKKA